MLCPTGRLFVFHTGASCGPALALLPVCLVVNAAMTANGSLSGRLVLLNVPLNSVIIRGIYPLT
ncbi:hypothetical protein I2494_09950 [Budviciaceae bacterium BWR-B9]|uniref:Uncharacterized protein n=1 Tax=Limnobaculum allomyrinae TaxID=2791986 RepID=A0ABS1IQJ9_9GAMM|nr:MULTISPECIES: hypothetical protein [Limnobaculum]MBK5144036.1 hypothetical protein [Limnobaculum allomyrinae]MBV7691695.1 hypothetical protein [Limnobaculum sp. M2-1]